MSFSLLRNLRRPKDLRNICRSLESSFTSSSCFTRRNYSIYYTKQHETVHLDNENIKIGISDFARQSLGDIIFLESECEIGDSVEEGEVIYNIESVKATSEILSPLDGELININEEITENVELIHDTKEEDLWLLEFEWNEIDTQLFMNKEEYDQFCKTEN